MGDGEPRALLDPLTERELEVLRYMAARWSDQEIADALFLSLNTIKWYNRQIYSKLGAANRRDAVAVAEQLDLLDAALNPANAAPRSHLPAQITSFVGRDTEITEVTRLLDSTRLLTITGPGGVGKTRLALQVARSFHHDGVFTNGMYFVDLAPLSDPALVARTIADTLPLSDVSSEEPLESLKQFLKECSLLLLLDNFEHLLEAAPLLADLLQTAPNLKILATSRERLQLSGEHVYPLGPLDQATAIELFRLRAQAAIPGFALDDTNRTTIEQIAVRLDRLPLAIELAAARIVLLPPPLLLERLEQRLEVLRGRIRDRPDRQQTLRATLDWSYGLLDEDEKMLFNRLGVFAGGCSMEAAEAVCIHGLSIDLLDGLESLLNKSMIWQEEGVTGAPRFWMLETMRDYALGQLEATGALDQVRSWHADYYAATAERHSRARGSSMWSDRVEEELDNLRAAVTWSQFGDPLPGMRIIHALELFWNRRDQVQARSWVAQMMPRLGDVPPAMQVRALLTASNLGPGPSSGEKEAEAVAIARHLDDPALLAQALSRLGLAELYTDRRDQAIAHLQEALVLFNAIPEPLLASEVLNTLGEAMRIEGLFEEAKDYYEQSLEIRDEMEAASAGVLCNLGAVARHLDDISGAESRYRQGIEVAWRVGDKNHIAMNMAGLAGVLAVTGDPRKAARLLGAAELIQEVISRIPDLSDVADYERWIADTRAHLDAEAFAEAWAEGRAMPLEDVVTYAMAINPDTTS